MDFAFTEEQDAVRDLAEQIFTGTATRRAGQGGRGHRRAHRPRALAELADADLLGIALPEAHGGSGLGLVELCLVLLSSRAAGRARCRCGPPSSAALPLAEFGTAEQQAALAPRRSSPATSCSRAGARASTPAGRGDARDGRRGLASRRLQAQRARRPPGRRACVVPAAADGAVAPVPRRPGRPTAPRSRRRRRPIAARSVTTSRSTARRPSASKAAPTPLDLRCSTARCVGLCRRPGRRVRGAHAHGRRVHVGAPAVRQAAVDVPGRRAQGRRRVHRHRGDAGHAVAGGLAARPRASTPPTRSLVAKWWASDGGQRVVHTTQHLHGGMGADVDYPVHRYFLWGKQIDGHARRRRARSWPASATLIAAGGR